MNYVNSFFCLRNTRELDKIISSVKFYGIWTIDSYFSAVSEFDKA